MDTGDLIQIGLLILAFLVVVGIVYLFLTQPLWIGLVASCAMAMLLYLASRFIL